MKNKKNLLERVKELKKKYPINLSLKEWNTNKLLNNSTIKSNKVKNIFVIVSENFKHSFKRKIYFFNQNKKFDNISWLVSVHRKNTSIKGCRCYVQLDFVLQLKLKKSCSTSRKSCDVLLRLCSTWEQQLLNKFSSINVLFD
jgi:hypothetical protein